MNPRNLLPTGLLSTRSPRSCHVDPLKIGRAHV